MRSLSNLDASFLHLETPHTPMHLVGIFIFRDAPNQRLTAAQFRRHLIHRVSTARVFRERLVVSPLGLGHAWWADDPDFCIDQHLQCSETDAPLTQTSLQPLADAFFVPLLRRERPLWEILFVSERTMGNDTTQAPCTRFGVILKVHHAACDGLSAKALIAGLFDGLAPATEHPILPEPQPLPSALELLARNTKAARQVGQDAQRFMSHALESMKQSLALRLQQTHTQPLFFTAPPTPFNIDAEDTRIRINVELSLPLLKRIRQTQPDTTVNDIVLAICGGALRRYLNSLGKNPSRPLIALAPVSKREDGNHTDAGNQVSAMLIALGTDIDNPIERLHTVRNNATRAKQFNVNTAYEKLLNHLPATATSIFLRAYTRSRLANTLPPIFNTVVTNIASLPATLNLNGAPLESVATYAPIFDAMGLSMVVLSHKDATVLGITSTTRALTHPALFATCLRQAQDELALASGALMSESARSRQPWTPPSGSIRQKTETLPLESAQA